MRFKTWKIRLKPPAAYSQLPQKKLRQMVVWVYIWTDNSKRCLVFIITDQLSSPGEQLYYKILQDVAISTSEHKLFVKK